MRVAKIFSEKSNEQQTTQIIPLISFRYPDAVDVIASSGIEVIFWWNVGMTVVFAPRCRSTFSTATVAAEAAAQTATAAGQKERYDHTNLQTQETEKERAH